MFFKGDQKTHLNYQITCLFRQMLNFKQLRRQITMSVKDLIFNFIDIEVPFYFMLHDYLFE